MIHPKRHFTHHQIRSISFIIALLLLSLRISILLPLPISFHLQGLDDICSYRVLDDLGTVICWTIGQIQRFA